MREMRKRILRSNAPRPPLTLRGGVIPTVADRISGHFLPPPLWQRGGRGALLLLLCCTAVLWFCSSASAATVNLPATGQARCYDAGGTVIGCSGTGQDGDRKAGVSVAGQRFTPGTGATAACVTDRLTGLMWAQTPDSTTRTWQAALDYVKNTVNASGGLCGFTDWRVPSIVELKSLVNAGYNEQSCEGSACGTNAAWLNAQGFGNVQSDYYWSSTTYAANKSYAWGVRMDGGYVPYHDKTFDYYVWPVRGGQ